MYFGGRETLSRWMGQLNPTDSSMRSGQEYSAGESTNTQVEPKNFSEYSFAELSQISKKIAAVTSENEAREIARRYNLITRSGTLVTDQLSITLKNGESASVRLVGIYHDVDASDNKLGCTFMLSQLGKRRMNEERTVEGGWKDSDLRAWLNSEGLSVLPDDLAPYIQTASKQSNNTGITMDISAITATDDKLWCFAATEVAGGTPWLDTLYFPVPNQVLTDGYLLKDYDAFLKQEGSQYAYFSEQGVSESGDPNNVLQLPSGDAWWYRSAYPSNLNQQNYYFFYQVAGSGFPYNQAPVDQPAGLVVGFCL